jgi:two-component system, LuxR family, response regulator FixJ
MNSGKPHIFFVDDEPAVRAAVKKILERSGMRVSVFSSAEDCLTGLAGQECNVLITDLRMSGAGGMSLLREVRRSFPWVSTLIVTGYGDIPLATAAMRAGAVDFIEKPLDQQVLLSAIERAIANSVAPDPRMRDGLSPAEAEVLRGVFDGKTSREIARSLNRSIRTVEAHRRSIMRKFNARNIAQLIQRASMLGFGNSDGGHGAGPVPVTGSSDPQTKRPE